MSRAMKINHDDAVPTLRWLPMGPCEEHQEYAEEADG
jgi:hypothetical protein